MKGAHELALEHVPSAFQFEEVFIRSILFQSCQEYFFPLCLFLKLCNEWENDNCWNESPTGLTAAPFRL